MKINMLKEIVILLKEKNITIDFAEKFIKFMANFEEKDIKMFYEKLKTLDEDDLDNIISLVNVWQTYHLPVNLRKDLLVFVLLYDVDYFQKAILVSDNFLKEDNRDIMSNIIDLLKEQHLYSAALYAIIKNAFEDESLKSASEIFNKINADFNEKANVLDDLYSKLTFIDYEYDNEDITYIMSEFAGANKNIIEKVTNIIEKNRYTKQVIIKILKITNNILNTEEKLLHLERVLSISKTRKKQGITNFNLFWEYVTNPFLLKTISSKGEYLFSFTIAIGEKYGFNDYIITAILNTYVNEKLSINEILQGAFDRAEQEYLTIIKEYLKEHVTFDNYDELHKVLSKLCKNAGDIDLTEEMLSFEDEPTSSSGDRKRKLKSEN